MFVGDLIVRKPDKGDDVVVCLPEAKIEVIIERVENIRGSGKGGSILVHIVTKYRQLVRTLKQTRIEQVIISRILPVIGKRVQRYRNCRVMTINMLVQKLYIWKRKLDLWGSFVGRADIYMRDGLHRSGKWAAVFVDKLSATVDSGMGSISNIFGSKHYLN